ncbi:hypothetical protein BbiDN127_E0018 (plasmid) [Borreliella bissettiae DN127]|uniref:Uncharacterized protein n=1 Tax=Borrelia bissettiae (strain DSM 17990 / CIP 109136 / DN127) TaxID=521010 RepID=G0AP29_BORBD|nr:hypothetical protein BbiDN127_E0018 [Borreliella bissettiae DN127]
MCFINENKNKIFYFNKKIGNTAIIDNLSNLDANNIDKN